MVEGEFGLADFEQLAGKALADELQRQGEAREEDEVQVGGSGVDDGLEQPVHVRILQQVQVVECQQEGERAAAEVVHGQGEHLLRGHFTGAEHGGEGGVVVEQAEQVCEQGAGVVVIRLEAAPADGGGVGAGGEVAQPFADKCGLAIPGWGDDAENAALPPVVKQREHSFAPDERAERLRDGVSHIESAYI